MIEGKNTLEQVGQIDHRLGVLFTQAAGALLIREGIDAYQEVVLPHVFIH